MKSRNIGSLLTSGEAEGRGKVNVMRWVALGLCGALIVSCGSDRKPEVGTTRQALFYSPAADAFAIYARNSIHIEDGSKVGGPVGVYLQDPVLPSDVLADDVRLAVGEWTDVGKTSQTDIFAATATFHFGANLKAAYTQRVDLDLHNLGTVSQNVSFIMLPFPRARPVTPGLGLLSVAASSTITITATTARIVEVQDGAVLRLGAGTYRFEDLLVADHAAVVAEGVVEVRVSSRIQVGKGARLFATSNTAGHLRIEALGRNGGLGLPTDTPRAIDIGDYSRVRAVLFAPNGTIKIGESTTSTGAVVAKDVWLGSSAKLAFQSGLAPLSGTVPLAYPDLFGATEDHALTVPAEGVLANDLDPVYDPITAVLVTHARNGTVSLAANGGFTYTPNAQFEGLDSFTYRASDGTLQSSVVTASIAVDSANDIPVISSEPPTTAYVGQRWRYLPMVVDPDVGDTKTFSLVSPPSGVTIDSATGLVSWTPVTAQIGTGTIVVRVVDAANTSDTQTFSVSVLASPALDHFSLYADNSLWLGGGVIDGSLGVRATGSGTWLNSYARTYIEANAIAGKVGGADLYGDTVVLGSGSIAQDVYTNSLVSDLSASRGAVVALPAMPALPTAASATPGTGTLSVPAYGTATLSPSQSYQTITVGSYGCLYLQPGTHHVQTLTLSTVGCLAAQGAVDLRVSGKLSAGSYAYIGPATGANITPSQFRIEVLGTNGGSGVWSTPLAVSLGTRSSIFATIIARNGTLETGGSSMNWGRFIARDIHAQGYFLLGEPSAENRAPAIVSSPITSIPERSNYVYAVTATDPDVDDTLSYSLITAPAGMTISSTAGTVRWPNVVIGSYPVAIRVSDAAGAIDTQGFTLTVTDVNDPPVISSSPSTSGTVGQAYSYAVAATDPENDALSYSLGSAPSGMSISAGGQVSWTPGTGQSGNASVSINVVDARGAYTTQNFTISVVSPNHAPVFTQSPSTQAVVGQLYASSTHALDQDVGDTIHYEIVSGPSGLTIDAATGALRWTPLSAQVGAQTLVLRVLDLAGASATQTTGLTVTLANRPPEFTSTPITTVDEGDSYSYQATATDPDAGDTVQFSLESGPAGLSMSTSGLVSWNPGNSQVGEFGVVLQIEDQAHHVVTQSYRITVNNVNAAPEITSQPPTQATEGIEYQYSVSANDPDAHDTLTFSLGGAPSGMSITGSRISWTPTHGQVGSHSVQVTVTDAGGLTASQSFSVTVADVNDPPSFVSSPALYATQHQAYTYAASALDPDVGDSVVYQLDVGPSGMSIHPTTGVVTWTPGPMQVGIYDVILRATDQTGALDIQSYTLSVANGNDPPAFITTPETSATENQLYFYAARALDPDPNTTLTYLLISGPAGMTVGRSTGDVRWVPGTADRGVHAVHIRVTDDVATADDQTFDVTVGGAAAACTGSDTSARCTALGFAYAIGRDSVPLAGVSVEETDPTSSHRSLTSDPRSGGVALGSGVSGEYEWLFHATGYVPAYRRGELADDRVTFTAVPRLTPITDAIATVESGGGTVADVDGLVSLSFASGAVSAATEIRLAVLDSQSLPGFLPRGYSPAAALWYEASASLSTTPSATLVLPAPVGASATLRLARWDASAAEWVYARAVSVTAPTAAHPSVTVQLDGPGGYAVVILDASPTAPPAVSVGQALQGASDPGFDLTSLEAHGVVEPTTQVASPIAQQVTGDGQVWVNPPTTTPSGLVLPARVYETYSFAEAPPSEVPTMDLSVALYRYPPVPGAPANALSAHFQVRPRQLIEGADVRQRIELLHAATFDGLPVDAAGGSIARDNIVLTIPSGAFTSPTLVRLAPMTDPALTLNGISATRVFTLEWSGDGLTAAAPFFLDVGMVAPNAEYVLARRFVTERGSGFTPVERFASNASGALSSVEPSSGARLPGIRVGGTYALFPVAAREGLLVGTARDAGGAALSDVLLEVSGRPWRALTAASGTFALLGLPGPVEVTATRPPSTDTGRASDTLPSAASSVALTVVVGQSAPFVVSITPSAGATEVSVVAPVDVVFSEPIAAASLAAPGVISLAKVTGAIVPGHVTTRIDRRGASFLPDRPLEPGTTYTATVAVVADDAGLTLTGTRIFHFTTAPERSIARASARLTSYAPGSAQNPCAPYNPNAVDAEFDPTGLSLGAPGFDAGDPHLTCVVGNVGTADPGLPVVIVNDDDGGATTVIARPNGSFKGYLRAAEEDLLTANFVRRDGSQLAIPLEMQRFDDGRVGLYSAGGVVRAPNPFGGEPFEIIVEPGSIGRRGVFKFSPQTPAEALAAVGVAPADGGLIVAGAVVEYSGDQLRTSADVRFPIAEEDLVLPPGSTAATAGFILTQSAQVRSGGQDVTVYDTIDRMRYEAGALGTHSYPMVGLMPLFGPSPFAHVQIIALGYAQRATPFSGHVVACVPDDPTNPQDPCYTDAVTAQATVVDGVVSISGRNSDVGLWERRGRALDGAFVAASSALQQSSVLLLRSGSLVAMTDRSGRYTLAVPVAVGSAPTFFATHPDYVHPSAGASGTSGFGTTIAYGFPTRLDFVFSEAIGANSLRRGPTISVTHTPNSPDPWDGQAPLTATNQARVALSARGSLEMPTAPELRVVEAAAVVAGQTVVPSDIVITDDALTEDVAGLSLRQEYLLTSPRAARVVLEARVTEGNVVVTSRHVLRFGTGAPPSTDSADPSDTTPPAILWTSPANGARGVALDEPIRIVFTKPISQTVLSHAADLLLTPPAGTPSLVLSNGDTMLDVVFPGLEPGLDYELEIGAGITDRASRSFDRDPSTEQAESTTYRFQTAAEAAVDLAGVVRGGGAAMHGGFAYVLDRGDGSLRVFNVTDPTAAGGIEVGHQLLTGGYPRSIRVIPDYSYVRPGPTGGPASPPSCNEPFPSAVNAEIPWTRNIDPLVPVYSACASLHRTLVAIIGGLTSNGGLGQYLAILDVTDPTHIVTVAQKSVTAESSATLGSLRWSPPTLAYLEYSGGDTRIHLVSLQEFIFGTYLSAEQLRHMPANGIPGVDADQDGSYVGPNDVLPMPPPLTATSLFGDDRVLRVNDTRQSIRDYFVDGPGLFVGVALSEGVVLDETGVPIANAVASPSYRTLSKGPLFNTSLPRSRTDLAFGGASVDAVFGLPRISIPIQESLAAPPTTELRDLVLVLASVPGTGASAVRAYLVDVTDPLAPLLVGPTGGIGIPVSNPVRRIDADPVSADRLSLFSVGNEQVTVSISQLGLLALDPSAGHPAILGVEQGLGGRTDIALGEANTSVLADADTNRVYFRGPSFEFVSFPTASSILDPTALAADSEGQVRQALAGMVSVQDLRLSRVHAEANYPSTITPASLERHYRVLVRAPGGDLTTGVTINLVAEGTNEAGAAAADAPVGLAPTRAVSQATFTRQGLTPNPDAPAPQPLTAHRLSNDRGSLYYNVYLSDTFALVGERLSAAEVDALDTVDGQPRRLFHSLSGLRVSIDPDRAPALLAPYASTIESGSVRVGTSGRASSFAMPRVAGPNPVPVNGSPAKAPGSMGMVNALNGELDLSSTDLALPSPMMPLVFARTYRAQDKSGGPLGPGWDFTYNQRIVEAKNTNVPSGEAIPLVVRESTALDTRVEAGDLKLQTGDGRILVFKRAPGTGVPVGYASDPLLTSLVGAAPNCIYYLPPSGIFDAMVRFGSHGSFLRLTPNGTQYKYDPSGRLTDVHAPFPANHHQVVLNDLGEIDAIVDRSTSTLRKIEIGYYRERSDPRFRASQDIEPENAGGLHKIARVIRVTGNSAHGDALFHYDDYGQLIAVDGVELAHVDPDGFQGRRRINYSWTSGVITGVAGADANGAVLLANTGATPEVASDAVGADGPVVGAPTPGNVARQLSNTRSHYTTADGTTTTFTWDALGRPTDVVVQGAGSTEATHIERNDDGLPTRRVAPRGNSIEPSYDSAHASIRSRGNLVLVNRVGGGDVISEERIYDPRYNTLRRINDALGRAIVMTLDLEGRTVDGVDAIDYNGVATETYISDLATGQLRGHVAPDGTTEGQTYDSSSGLLETTSIGTLTTTYVYTGCSFGPDLGAPCSIVPPQGAPDVFTYSEDGSVRTHTKGGLEERFAYDRNGRKTKSERLLEGQTWIVERFRYNQVGFLEERKVEQLETGGTLQTVTWTNTPDARNRLQSSRASAGTLTTYGYDFRGRVAEVHQGSHVESFGYDPNGNLHTRTQGGTTWTMNYDGHDRLESSVVNGTTTLLTYHPDGSLKTRRVVDQAGVEVSKSEMGLPDAAGRVEWRKEGDVETTVTFGLLQRTTVGPEGATTIESFDSAGRSTNVENVGHSARSTAYNESASTVTTTSMEGGRSFETTQEMDELGHVRNVKDASQVRLVRYETRTDGAVTQRRIAPDSLNVTTTLPVTLLGETMGRQSASGVALTVGYDEARHVTSEGRPGSTRQYHYDDAQRLDRIDEPDGKTWAFLNFDARNRPQNVLFPGGSQDLTYDAEGRLLTRLVTTPAYTDAESFTPDAEGRVTRAEGTLATLSRAFDLRGVVTDEQLSAFGQTLLTHVVPYENRAPNTTTYPSNVTVTDVRDSFGRLTAKTDDANPLPMVVQAAYQQLAEAPSEVTLGNGVIRTDAHDDRKRLTSRKYTRGGQALVDLRYVYDLADREVARQSLHRGGRVDFFSYDSDSRLQSAEYGARPALAGTEEAGTSAWSVQLGVTGGAPLPGTWRPGDYRRNYSYGLADTMTSVATSVAYSAPTFFASSQSVDAFGHIDGIEVGAMSVAHLRDDLGNTTSTFIEGATASLTFDGLSRLRRILRGDGSEISLGYRADGVLLSRTVSCSVGATNCVSGQTMFVYVGMQLFEEYAVIAGVPSLRLRYYYEDSDIPLGADVFDGSPNPPQRVWFETDRLGSVIGILDEAGNELERIRYDSFGRPTYEPPDLAPPAISSIARQPDGSLVVAFTEQVLPPPSAGGTSDLISTLQPLAAGFQVVNHGTGAPIAGTWELDEGRSGFDRGTTLRFVPGVALPLGTQVDLTLLAGALMDRVTNRVTSTTLPLTMAAGSVFAGPAQGSTAVAPTARSSVGVDLGFHAHLHEPNSGLVLARARVLDPVSGQYLSRDPELFRDSVNLYAFVAGDPINHRDPTGQCVWETDPAKQKECWSKAGAALQRAKGANVDPHQCEAALRQILDGTYSGIPDETTADCIFATYSMKDGVTVTSAAEKEAGVDLDRDALHRRFVRLLAQYEIRTEAKYRRKSTQRLFAAAINRGAIRRTNLGLTESLLGRDVNRYFYGRMSQFYDQIQAVYEGAKKYLPDSVITRGSKHPASARGGRYFVEAGIRHSAACGYAPAVPIFEPTDAPMIPNYSTEDSLETEICVPEDQLFPDLPPLDMADIY